MKDVRVLRNMGLIGLGVSSISFFTGLRTAKGNYYFNYPSNNKNFQVRTINSINDIEDLEYQKGCKFLFYKTGSDVKVNEVRDFKEKQEEEIFKKVVQVKDKCQQDAFVYVGFP